MSDDAPGVHDDCLLRERNYDVYEKTQSFVHSAMCCYRCRFTASVVMVQVEQLEPVYAVKAGNNEIFKVKTRKPLRRSSKT